MDDPLAREDAVLAQAHGILMARHECDLLEADLILTMTAGEAVVTNVEMAEQIVAEVEQGAGPGE